MFLVAPFTLLAIGVYGVLGSATHTIPINFTTSILMLLLFPLFFVLLSYIEEDHTLSNLDAAAMTGIYALMLYVLLFMSPGGTAPAGGVH
jgi:hypothetical protein